MLQSANRYNYLNICILCNNCDMNQERLSLNIHAQHSVVLIRLSPSVFSRLVASTRPASHFLSSRHLQSKVITPRIRGSQMLSTNWPLVCVPTNKIRAKWLNVLTGGHSPLMEEAIISAFASVKPAHFVCTFPCSFGRK